MPIVSRSAFTKVELLAVVAMLAILAGLILPATRSSRVNVRRHQCLNNLKNVTAATNNYAAFRGGELPPLRTTWTDEESGRSQTVGWPIELLPFFDQQALYAALQTAALGEPHLETREWDYLTGVVVPGCTCPDDPWREDGELSYAMNVGLMPYVAGRPFGDRIGASPQEALFVDRHTLDRFVWGTAGDARVSRAAMLLHDGDEPLTIDEINTGDGATQTIVAAENLDAGRWASPYLSDIAIGWQLTGVENGVGRFVPFDRERFGGIGELGDESLPLLASRLTTRWRRDAPHPSLPGDSLDPTDEAAPRPSSAHPGVVNVFYWDGHGGVLTKEVDPSVYRRLLTPNGTAFGEGPLANDAF